MDAFRAVLTCSGICYMDDEAKRDLAQNHQHGDRGSLCAILCFAVWQIQNIRFADRWVSDILSVFCQCAKGSLTADGFGRAKQPQD